MPYSPTPRLLRHTLDIAMLELTRVNAHYGKNHVLRDLSLRVDKGSVIALIGANAAGKSTTLRTIIGLKRESSGELSFDGKDIRNLNTAERVRNGLVLVPEGRQIFPKFTVAENLQMGAYHRSDRDRIDAEIATVFEMFPRLQERRAQRAGSMSGGEQQMLAIARGLIAKPRCLLLDEPTLGLAPIIVEEIATTVRSLAERGMTVLIAEQNASFALRLASRAYVIESGSVSTEGSAGDLEANEVVRRNYLGA